MPYSQFTTITNVKEAFGITTVEGVRFLPEVAPIPPSQKLQSILEDLPWAIAVDTEKARSEVIINPVLLEVRHLLKQEISVFSGEQFFDVDAEIGLNGICGFLMSRSPEHLAIEAPAIVIVEAKRSDLKAGIGQCVAEMIAAQRFNEAKQNSTAALYGCVSSGTQWRFLKLEGTIVTIDLMDYPLPPVEQILGFFVWMIQHG